VRDAELLDTPAQLLAPRSIADDLHLHGHAAALELGDGVEEDGVALLGHQTSDRQHPQRSVVGRPHPRDHVPAGVQPAAHDLDLRPLPVVHEAHQEAAADVAHADDEGRAPDLLGEPSAHVVEHVGPVGREAPGLDGSRADAELRREQRDVA
jgi:hypothetical protein